MTQGFDEYEKSLDGYIPHYKVAYQDGAQSRQAEIDELQKRIDEAVNELEYPKASWDEVIYNVIKKLKGKNND